MPIIVRLLCLFCLIGSDALQAQSLSPCDSFPLVATATNTNFTCQIPLANVSANLQPSIVSYQWTGPNGFSSNKAFTRVPKKGTYTLIVVDTRGCSDTLTRTVQDLCQSNYQLESPLQPFECPDPEIPFPAESCSEACISKCLGRPYYGSTGGFAADPAPPEWCSMIQNDQWFSFMATTTYITLKATPSNCSNGDGIQVAIYDACSNALVCNAGGQGQGTTPMTLVAGPLVLGRAYYIIVDGFSGDICDFTLESEELNSFFCPINNPTPGTGTPPPTTPNPPNVNVCPNATVFFNIYVNPNALVSGFYWTGPQGTLIDGQPVPVTTYNPEGLNVAITFGSNDNSPVCVRALTYFLPPSEPLCIPFTFDSLNIVLPLVTVCNEDLPYILPWGDEAFSSGTYFEFETNANGCDSVIRQTVKVLPPIIKNQTVVICKGEHYQICGTQISTSGIYSETCESYQGCDSTVVINLNVLNPIAVITGNTVLGCGQSLVLGSLPSSGSKTWKNLITGAFAGVGNQLTVTQPGTYMLTTAITASGLTCIEQDTVVITQDIANLPSIVVTQQVLNNCTNTQAILTATSNATNATFNWSGPNNFTAQGTVQTVTQPGIYTVTVTNPANGCSRSTTTLVAAPTLLQATGTVEINCSPQPIFLASSNAIQPVYTWSTNGNNAYTLTVTDESTGCVHTVSATTIFNTTPPNLTATGTTINCLASAFQVTAMSDAPAATYTWIGPNGFSSQLPSPSVLVPGVYTVAVTDPSNSCTSAAEVLVVDDTNKPNLQVSQASPSCNDSLLTLQAASNTPEAEVYWTGPNGFIDSSDILHIAVADWYVAHCIGLNGCERIISLLAQPAPVSPLAIASGDTITCQDLVAQLGVQTDSPSATFAWTGPHNFTSTLQNPTVDSAGVYVVIVTGSGGCQTTAQATVVDDCLVSTQAAGQVQAQVRVYPVPANGLLSVLFPADWVADNVLFDLYGIQGQLVWSTRRESVSEIERIDLNQLPSGNYLLRLQADSKSWYGKVMLLKE